MSIRPLQPLKALEFFRSLIPISGIKDPGQWSDDKHRVAFTTATNADEVVLDRIKRTIQATLASGDVAGGQELLEKVLDNSGVSPNRPGYAELLMRTNLMDAFQQGSHEEMKGLEDEFPVWRYVGIHDGRQRPSHDVHFDKYFPASTSFAQVRDSVKGSFDGFNCRCSSIPIHKSEWSRLQSSGARTHTFAEQPPTDVRQQRSFTCGPAALRSALHTLTGTNADESELSKELSTSERYGTAPDAITEAAASHGLGVRQQSLCTLADLRRHTDGSGLVLTPIQLHDGGHWVVVYAVDADGIHFHDPVEGDSVLPVSQWNRGWMDTATAGGTRYYIRHSVFLSSH